MNEHSPSKFARYRARKKAAGLREVRIWVPDVNAPELWEQSVREAEILRVAQEDEETMRAIEAAHEAEPGLFN